ncbi:hypothetical protein EDD85DRAFT_153106 [Armillaria nabsnona]|nr:hypothetical protein EDD85DRAFT_153106 [Armillaria nabsnona]
MTPTRSVLRCRPLLHLLRLRATRLHSFSPTHLLPSAFGTAGFGPSLPAIWFPRRSRRRPVSYRDFGLGLSIQLEHSHPSKIGLESVFTFKFPTANLSQVPVFRQTTRIHVKPYSSVSAAFNTKTTWYKSLGRIKSPPLSPLPRIYLINEYEEEYTYSTHIDY